MDFEKILASLIPTREECLTKVQDLRGAYPELTDEQLAHEAIAQAKILTAATGGVTGAITNPAALLPLAVTEMGLVLDREARLVGVITALLEPNILKDPDAFAADIYAILFPSAVSQALREVAVRAGKVTLRTVIRRHLSRKVLRRIILFSARYLGIKLTQRTLITKTLPVVGAVIGAGWNWVEVERLGKRALRYYQDEDAPELPEPPATA